MFFVSFCPHTSCLWTSCPNSSSSRRRWTPELHHPCRNITASDQGICDKCEQRPFGGQNDVRKRRLWAPVPAGSVWNSTPRCLSAFCFLKVEPNPLSDPQIFPSCSLSQHTLSTPVFFLARQSELESGCEDSVWPRCVLHCGSKTAAKGKKSKDKKDTLNAVCTVSDGDLVPNIPSKIKYFKNYHLSRIQAACSSRDFWL